MNAAGDAVQHFRMPNTSFGSLKADIAGKLIAAAADVALVIDGDGTIRDSAAHSDELGELVSGTWIGRPWIETVTVESRPKIEALLRDAGSAAPRARQVNHPIPDGEDLPILYTAVAVGETGRVVAVGRDLRQMAEMQQRLVNAQQSMEREYSRLRHAETRYRILFQLASEAVLIVDSLSLKVTEANPASVELLRMPTQKIVGRPVRDLFVPESAQALGDLLTRVRAAGRCEDMTVRFADGGGEARFNASLFRQDRSSHFLVRLGPLHVGTGAIIVPKMKSRLLNVVETLPDGFVVTDPELRILTVNQAFLDLVQLPAEDLARDEPLDRWLGRSGVDLKVLIATLREHGSVRNFMTVMRGEYGASEEVEISAVAVTGSDQPCFGLTIRVAGRRPAALDGKRANDPHSVARLTELVGRVSLKDLVRETTDVVEKLCVEAALELTDDNRASAAEMLGLSRQSLYAKLRRFGLGDLGPGDGDAE